MGLDTTHDAWSGSYGSFNRFRHELAKRIGIDLKEYHGYNDSHDGKDLKSIDHPLKDLFDHSDCDGELTPKQSYLIAQGFDRVILDSPIPESFEDKLFIEQCIQFREGCMRAYSKQENIEFR